MNARGTFYGELDLGLLCLTNATDLSEENLDGEERLKSLVKKGAQYVFEKLRELPVSYDHEVAIVKLPPPTTILPRAKPIPKPKPLTRWQKFAQKKGINKKKREKLIWNEASKSWKPRYGYRSKANDKSDWMVEIPDNADPYQDYIGKKKEKKAENIAKNEYQRLKNLAAANKTKVSTMESVDKADKNELLRSISTTKTATASLGKFTQKLPKEKSPKNNFKKRKFDSNNPSDINAEKQRNFKVLEDMRKKNPKLDIKEAVQREMKKMMPSKSPEELEKIKNKKQRRVRESKNSKKNKSFTKKKGGRVGRKANIKISQQKGKNKRTA